ncbi:MAG: cupin domain-containing protein [Rhizobiaceae bacterium]|nr:cupin domain-containing protein [Rhizobiaceae bacterium]
MPIPLTHLKGFEGAISIPAIGLELIERLSASATEGAFSIIETINAPGFGPPRHRHQEAEIFRVLEGRYLFEVDGRRFYAEAGDVINVPGGVSHAFVNVTDKPASQYIVIAPGLDAVAFFTGLGEVMRNGRPDTDVLNVFAEKWGMEFLGPPLKASDTPTEA